MTGWEKVIAATVLAVVGLVGLNLSIWRRLKVARAAAVEQVAREDREARHDSEGA